MNPCHGIIFLFTRLLVMIMKDPNVFIRFTIIGYDITTETTFSLQGLLKNNYMYRESEVVLVVSLLFCDIQ